MDKVPGGQGDGNEQGETALAKPDWTERWEHIPPRLQLWGAIALSCNIDPNGLNQEEIPAGLRTWHEDPSRLTGDERAFCKRLMAAQADLGEGLPALEAFPPPPRWRWPVRLEDIRAWLVRNKCEAPAAFLGPAAEPPTRTWPWGEGYTPPLLGYVIEVVEEFWLKYDPNFPATAPYQADVVKRIRERHPEVSENEAKAIWTVTRPAELKPGPRVNK